MTRDSRYDILFEPVKIGPVTAKNRFYQAPHCNGMGRTFPSSMAAMRGVKAEGGWAVVSTEQIDIHPTSDITPSTEGILLRTCLLFLTVIIGQSRSLLLVDQEV